MIVSPRAWCYRAGLTYSCVLTLLLYAIACFLIEWQLPVGNSIFHKPIFNSALVSLMVIASYLFFAYRWRKKQPYVIDYLCSFGVALLFYVVLSTFCYVKSTIPYFMPYYLDPLLQKIDLLLHGGTSPFMLLDPFMTPRLYGLLDRAYADGWFLLMDIYVFWQLFYRRDLRARARFLSTFVMSWMLIGNGLAMLFSSVGPLYYSLFFHDGYSAMNDALVTKLYAIHQIVPLNDMIHNRELLLGWYKDGAPVHMNIMSAMPSLHTGVAILLLLHSACYERRLLPLTIPFALLICLGSVLLGWHYAVDTYVSGLCVGLLWWLNGRELRKNETATVLPSSESVSTPLPSPAAPTGAHSSPTP